MLDGQQHAAEPICVCPLAQKLGCQYENRGDQPVPNPNSSTAISVATQVPRKCMALPWLVCAKVLSSSSHNSAWSRPCVHGAIMQGK